MCPPGVSVCYFHRDGQISRDYAREFPSVEVGGRQVMKNEELRTSLQTVQLESEVSARE